MVQELEHRYGAEFAEDESSEEEEEEEETDEEEEDEEEESEEDDEDEEEEESEEESGEDEFEDEDDGEGKVKRIVNKMEAGKKGGDGEKEESEEEEESDEEESDEEESDEEKEKEEGDKAFSDEPDDGGLRDVDAEQQMQRRKMILGVVCICLVTIILAVVLGVTLGDKDDDDDKKPPITPPSAAPSAVPSPSPTLHPDQIFFPVIADTYIRGGEFANETFGNSTTLQVFGGANSTDPAYILLEFDLSNLPPDGNIFRESEILLRLSHVQRIIAGESDSISVIKLPYDETLDLETLTWDEFTPENGVIGPSFTVEGDTDNVLVDITDLIRGPSSRLRKGRRLQNGKLFIQLENEDSANEFGELFRSREDGAETAPVIIHNFKTTAPSAAPSISPAPSGSREPSPAPSISSSPTITVPPSGKPSTGPSSSPPPTLTESPTKTAAPSLAV